MIGIAIFGTLLTATLGTQLPKYLPAEMGRSGMAATGFHMGQLQSGNTAAVGDQVRKGFDDTYAVIDRALAQGDAGALKRAFTDAIERLFFWSLFVVALGFVVTLFLPERALRKEPPRNAEAGGA